MRTTIGIAAILLLAGIAVPAMAQNGHQPIESRADRPYRFRHSKLAVPPTLDGMPRVGVRQLGTGELDVYAMYERGPDAITVYNYRDVVGGIPVWFDRARAAVEERAQLYGTATSAGAPVAFTPPGQRSASGLIGAWTVTKPPYRGTALAILPMNGWLVKIRYSSTTLDGPALLARMPAVLAALDWPRTIAAAPVATPVANCATPLAFPATAEPLRDTEALKMAAVASGLVAGAATAKREQAVATPVAWCRDPAPVQVGAAYRANGDADAYLLAFSDSGRGAWVGRDTIGEELARSKGTSLRQWSINVYDMDKIIAYPPMTALPRPDQVLTAMNGPSMSSTTTFGGRPQVSINPSFMR